METNSTKTFRRPNPLTALLSHRVFVLVLRVFLGVLFMYSAADKVLDPERFAIAARAYKLLPIPLTNLFALVLSWSEMLAGIMLFFGVQTRKAAAAVFILLVMFTIAIGTTIVRGFHIDCGCFRNEGGSQTGYLLIIRNLFLMTVALIIMRFETGYLGLSRIVSKKPSNA
jgi:putative oxidoreductase